ncbi:hypothetical protein [Klebsiella quasipneumoniae]|uniref:hypothetical protein n=1 Tax=Klebsiella quasipneumoniae TaxID=1463165 RepID=UPI0031DF5A5B
MGDKPKQPKQPKQPKHKDAFGNDTDLDIKKYFEGRSADEIRKLIEKDGIFFPIKNIERLFNSKFISLRKKIHRFLDDDFDKKYDSLDKNVYLQSILVDCRAMFLESPRRKDNGTMQNIFIIRNFPEMAEKIDNAFNEKIEGDITYRKIIKDIVDQRIAHYDYVDDEVENKYLEHLELIINREDFKNIFILLLSLSIDYKSFLEVYGETYEEQFNQFLNFMTDESEE